MDGPKKKIDNGMIKPPPIDGLDDTEGGLLCDLSTTPTGGVPLPPLLVLLLLVPLLRRR